MFMIINKIKNAPPIHVGRAVSFFDTAGVVLGIDSTKDLRFPMSVLFNAALSASNFETVPSGRVVVQLIFPVIQHPLF